MVIAIIAVLAAMMLPALGAAKGMALASQCRGNMRQFGLAIDMYGNDYNEYLPASCKNNFIWIDLCLPQYTNYIRDKRVAVCPAQIAVVNTYTTRSTPTNYSYNSRTGDEGIFPSCVQWKQSQIKYPNRLVMLTDANASLSGMHPERFDAMFNAVSTNSGGKLNDYSLNADAMNTWFGKIHSKTKVNILYLSGNVAYLDRKPTGKSWAEYWEPWKK